MAKRSVSRRLHLFELNDSPWAPVALRETVIEALSRTLSWGRILEGLAPPLARFVKDANVREVLDLCAGAGAPAQILVRELERAGLTPPTFLLTDLQPHPKAWRALARAHPGVIEAIETPVDASEIPDAIGRGRARVIINALHHFPPALASSILVGAAKDAPGVFIAEGFERAAVPGLGFAPFALAGLPALFSNPLLAPEHKLQKMALTWLTPIALAASAWDGCVSTVRVYDEAELRRMVAPVTGMRWTYGTWDFFPGGRGYYFHGVRTQ